MGRDNLEEIGMQLAGIDKQLTLFVKGAIETQSLDAAVAFMNEIAAASPSITVRVDDTATEDGYAITEIWREDIPTGVMFYGIPVGKELSVFLQAIRNAAGLDLVTSDDKLRERIIDLKRPMDIYTFVSYDCDRCTKVAKALDTVVCLNPFFSNRVIDIQAAPHIARDFNVQSVPAVYANGDLLDTGNESLSAVATALVSKFGATLTGP